MTLSKPRMRKSKNEDCLELFKRIKEVRVESGLTQGALAKQAGISLPTLKRIEKGEISISLEKLLRIMEFLGLELTYKDGSLTTPPEKEDSFDAW